jgi:hypothetical protein
VDPVEDRHVRIHPRLGQADSAASLAGAISRAVTLLERHRRRSVREGTSRRPSRRYEERYVAAAIARLERHLRVAEEVTDSEGIRRWVEDVVADRSAERDLSPEDAAWLSARARRRANVRARRRFEALASEVIAELERVAPSQIRDPEPEARPARCTALTRRGTRCKNAAEKDGLCGLHARLARRLVLVR